MFEIEKEAGISKLVIREEENISKIEEEIKNKIQNSDIDMICIQNPSEEIREHFIKQGFHYRPNKVTYKMRIPHNVSDYFKLIKRNRRKKIKKALKQCLKIGIDFVRMHPVSEEFFKEWYEIYEKNIISKPHGFIRVTSERYTKNYDMLYGVFATHNGAIIGGIFLKKKQFTYDGEIRDKLSISFSASKKEFFKLRINDALNYQAIAAARSWGFDFLERGMDTNLYGHYLSSGLYLFKKSFGYKIAPKRRYEYSLIKIINFDNFQDKIFFTSLSEGEIIGNLFFKAKMPNIKEFSSSHFSKLRIFQILTDGAMELEPIYKKQIIKIE